MYQPIFFFCYPQARNVFRYRPDYLDYWPLVKKFDSDSNELWIGTRNGLTYLNLERHSFRTFLPEANNPGSLGDSEIRS
ncbi:MAG: hypothetical protein AAFU74_16595, partial [Bacteroidota bacterium]